MSVVMGSGCFLMETSALRLTLSLPISSRMISIEDDFSSSSRFQWMDIHFANSVPLFTWKANDQWSILAAPIVRLNTEGDAKLKDGVRGGGIVGFNYHLQSYLVAMTPPWRTGSN